MTSPRPTDGNTSEPPTLEAYRSLDGATLHVWCQYCRVWHEHSAHASSPDCPLTSMRRPPCTCPSGSGDGGRVAHCYDRNSPYLRNTGPWKTGYMLREVGPFTPEVQRAKEAEA
jgi:hypothetical protein